VNDGELLNSGIEFDVTAHLLKAMIILLTSQLMVNCRKMNFENAN
jgi:hypothetical protein